MLNTLHICSTDLGWKPLYIQVGRNYSFNYSDCDNDLYAHVYDNNKKLILDYEKSITFWNEYILKEETEENNTLIPIIY